MCLGSYRSTRYYGRDTGRPTMTSRTHTRYYSTCLPLGQSRQFLGPNNHDLQLSKIQLFSALIACTLLYRAKTIPKVLYLSLILLLLFLLLLSLLEDQSFRSKLRVFQQRRQESKPDVIHFSQFIAANNRSLHYPELVLVQIDASHSNHHHTC